MEGCVTMATLGVRVWTSCIHLTFSAASRAKELAPGAPRLHLVASLADTAFGQYKYVLMNVISASPKTTVSGMSSHTDWGPSPQDGDTHVISLKMKTLSIVS
jgi:hypothetical protein